MSLLHFWAHTQDLTHAKQTLALSYARKPASPPHTHTENILRVGKTADYFYWGEISDKMEESDTGEKEEGYLKQYPWTRELEFIAQYRG